MTKSDIKVICFGLLISLVILLLYLLLFENHNHWLPIISICLAVTFAINSMVARKEAKEQEATLTDKVSATEENTRLKVNKDWITRIHSSASYFSGILQTKYDEKDRNSVILILDLLAKLSISCLDCCTSKKSKDTLEKFLRDVSRYKVEIQYGSWKPGVLEASNTLIQGIREECSFSPDIKS